MTPRRRSPRPDQREALTGFGAHLKAKIATLRADLVRLEGIAAAPDAPPGARGAAEAARVELEGLADALAHVRRTLKRAAPPETR